ncbi:putative protein kinase RLK-Pelle-DLSV family [Helianthus annuus]|nr:putative protein kinase RLK-Pelle-DLSV family [Helianthus annuus]
MEDQFTHAFFFITLMLLLSDCTARDSMSANKKIKDGETLVSEGQMFELGFFSPGKSKNRYLGIWYKKISKGTVVWVANRETPITDRSGMLKLSTHGNLVIHSGGNPMVWSSGSTTVSVQRDSSVVVQLLDSGNLVVWKRNSTNNVLIWQSFDYPGDTHLAGMKFGKDLVTGLERFLTSWKSPDDPSIGVYRNIMDTNGYPQTLGWQGEVLLARVGPWNGVGFSGFPTEKENQIYSTEFVINEKEIYLKYELKSSVVQRVVLTWDGKTLFLHWIERIQDWVVYSEGIVDSCDRYSLCGPFGVCSIRRHPPCTCMQGFEPRNPEEWKASDWVSGCKRKKPLNCGNGDGFWKISRIKVPDTRRSWYNVTMTLAECEIACKRNCSCTGFGSLDIRNGGSGCLLWFDELMDTREYDGDQDIFIRMDANELEGDQFVEKNTSLPMKHLDDLQFFSLFEVAKATCNFSVCNKIGEGGFGPVYKGALEDGREIAVKRLSETSQQGLDEFKNEVICIASLQHRNLVKLLGYCIHQKELILIYEYLSNKSLDFFLFDETRSLMLDWSKRFNIIHGTARGILYLHQDSRLQIIHRDLKVGNILLDSDMNPKISDFGLARNFIGHDTTANTKKVVGTCGYISPEYAAHGRFSIKSDVFSFGVIVLEIISGIKNREFFHGDRSDNLLGHTPSRGRSIEIMSATLDDSCVVSEVLRCIHVALLCVQHHAEDRPTMLSVVLMLVSEGVLPHPKQPAFFAGESDNEVRSGSSVDEYTITKLYAR